MPKNGHRFVPSWRLLGADSLLDPTILMLIYLSRHSLMPELYELLGQSKFIQFVELFGGTNLHVPSKEDLREALRDAHIYTELRDDQHNLEKTRALGDKYSLTTAGVRKIFERVQTEFMSIEESGQLLKYKRDQMTLDEISAVEFLESDDSENQEEL